MSNPFLPDGYRSLPDHYLPVVQAAALLAFGDLDYIAHLTEVRIVKNSSFPEGRESRVEKESCPKIAAEVSHLYQKAAAGAFDMIGRKRKPENWNSASPPCRDEYELIPASDLKFNVWGFAGLDMFYFAICNPYDSVTKTGGVDNAKWFYPAVDRNVLDMSTALDAAIRATLAARGRPGRSVLWKEFFEVIWQICDAKPTDYGFGERTIRRRVAALM
jgi:hypothetical protein